MKTLQKTGDVELSDVVELNVSNIQAKANSVGGKYYEVKAEVPYRYIYVGRVNSCRAGGCSIISGGKSDTSSEYFDYFIMFDELASVKLVKVFNYAATHGQEVTAKGWLKQFVGYNGEEKLQVDKNIDAISGATISVYAITEDVIKKTALLKSIL